MRYMPPVSDVIELKCLPESALLVDITNPKLSEGRLIHLRNAEVTLNLSQPCSHFAVMISSSSVISKELWI
jgi:CheY-specific phosphatase CheX